MLFVIGYHYKISPSTDIRKKNTNIDYHVSEYSLHGKTDLSVFIFKLLPFIESSHSGISELV